MKLKHYLIIGIICVVLFVTWTAFSAKIDDIVEQTIETVELKLKYFHFTGNFAIFHDIEANKHIIGLDSEQDIKRFRMEGMRLWCFVPAQILRNYLLYFGIPAYIVLIRSDGLLQPYQWDYHMVTAIDLVDGRVAVIDSSKEGDGPHELDYYLRQFSNKNISLTAIRTNEELEMFLQPTEMMKPKKKFIGKTIEPNFGREI